jgi:hypothetical protein
MRESVSFVAVVILLMLSLFDLSDTLCASSCGCTFQRGDVNNDGDVNVADSNAIANYLFNGAPICNLDRADTNDDGAVDMSDIIYLNCWLFGGSGCPNPPPPPPAPWTTVGCDPTPDNLEVCCSRSAGAGDPESLPIIIVNSCTNSGNTWDYINCSKGTNRVAITTQNDAVCAHPDTTVFWAISWQLNDPHGVEDTALNSGCVKVKARVEFQTGYWI